MLNVKTYHSDSHSQQKCNTSPSNHLKKLKFPASYIWSLSLPTSMEGLARQDTKDFHYQGTLPAKNITFDICRFSGCKRG